MSRLEVELGARSYPIYIGRGLLADSELLGKYVDAASAFVVSNETVAPLYLDQLVKTAGLDPARSVVLADGEQYKNIASMQKIFDAMIAGQCDRGTTILALGGGVVGDMAGFAAACYQRGVRFVQFPTTLLAQVDSSVGGKTGVNHPLGKNMIGAFHQPGAVFIDTNTLDTLADREYRAGIAEVIKYGFIRDREFLQWLHENMARLLARDPDALRHAIMRSCACKAAVVADDETENGVRAILNFGHTFGHAIESATAYSALLHGEAVGLGMLMALDFCKRCGLIDAHDFESSRQLIEAAGLPVLLPHTVSSGKQLLRLMQHDKKVKRGRVRLVLLKGLGEAFITGEYSDELLEELLESYVSQV
ncbi:MAG: 3-dehydroquinate synthase [Pseudomonadales bacterium]|nr:3-dehydroquinate synthase [Pseudomonadales bacterium]